jgi:hypothetical protein
MPAAGAAANSALLVGRFKRRDREGQQALAERALKADPFFSVHIDMYGLHRVTVYRLQRLNSIKPLAEHETDSTQIMHELRLFIFLSAKKHFSV